MSSPNQIKKGPSDPVSTPRGKLRRRIRPLVKATGIVFLATGLMATISFAWRVEFNPDPTVWFTPAYYSQFLPLAVSCMLLVSGLLLTFERSKANFYLAVFGHTSSEEAAFHWIGLTRSSLPTWVMWVFFILSLVALCIAYGNLLGKKRLSVPEALFGLALGTSLALFGSGSP
ncbi:MAG: hypothetical protein R3F07_11600 [Opitutaceae bacterium]